MYAPFARSPACRFGLVRPPPLGWGGQGHHVLRRGRDAQQAKSVGDGEPVPARCPASPSLAHALALRRRRRSVVRHSRRRRWPRCSGRWAGWRSGCRRRAPSTSRSASSWPRGCVCVRGPTSLLFPLAPTPRGSCCSRANLPPPRSCPCQHRTALFWLCYAGCGCWLWVVCVFFIGAFRCLSCLPVHTTPQPPLPACLSRLCVVRGVVPIRSRGSPPFPRTSGVCIA